MVEGGDDSSSARLLDVIERNRITRPKPPPSLLHVLMIYSRLESGIGENRLGCSHFARAVDERKVLDFARDYRATQVEEFALVHLTVFVTKIRTEVGF